MAHPYMSKKWSEATRDCEWRAGLWRARSAAQSVIYFWRPYRNVVYVVKCYAGMRTDSNRNTSANADLNPTCKTCKRVLTVAVLLQFRRYNENATVCIPVITGCFNKIDLKLRMRTDSGRK